MARFKLALEYAGTRYSGWQIQKNARTVSGELRRVVSEVTNQREVQIYGSGRTDAGVHALGQVAHLDVETRIAPERLRLSINDLLPSDIHVLSLERASPRFHARHDAVGRSYLYQISRRRTAFGKPFVWWIRDELSARKMAEAGRVFRGMHDFRSFTDPKMEVGSTKVLLEEVAVAEAGALILIRIVGSHFLWKMVRRMVGVLAEAGRGRFGPAEVKAMLAKKSNVPAGLTAPPSGLFLERVFYAGEESSEPPLPVIDIR
ncbi:MAG: tRNA pseudouridine(38-40) synthase TruA [Vicinamibacteria bacterium]